VLDCNQIIEYDLNPFFEFDKNGRILNTNIEGEFLLSKVDRKTIFNLAISHAPMSFGFKNKYIDLKFDRIKFYALGVGYNDVDSIMIRLYKITEVKKERNTEYNESVNIYELIDLAISSILISNINLKIDRIFDPTIPNININSNKFLSIINKILENFIQYKNIEIILRLKIGEYIKIGDEKYQVIQMEIKSNKRDTTNDNIIENLASKISIYPIFGEKSIILELPLIS
jgi:hypothetical protein